MKTCLFAAAIAAGAVMAAWPAWPAKGKLSSQTMTGTVVTPRNFPKHNADDLRDMFKRNAELGSFAVVRVNWNDPQHFEVAKVLVAMGDQQSLAAVVELSPFKADGLKGASLDPGTLVSGASRSLSFTNPAVSEAFSKAVLELAEIKPEYLAVATDVNLYAMTDPAGFAAFANLYRAIYPQIKQISPNTKIFVTFQWDAMQGQSAAANAALLDAWGSSLDLLALTSEPRKVFAKVGPAGIPADYYSRVSQYQSANRPVFLEVNWPSDGGNGEADQAAFIRALPDLLGKVNPSMLAWTFLYDVRIMIVTVRAGLIHTDGREKPAYAAFREISGDRPPLFHEAAVPASGPRSAPSTASKEPAYFGIYTGRLDGTDVQTIMTSPDREMTHPRVSPDGKRLVLTRYNNRAKDGKATEDQGYDNTEIMIVNIDCRGLETIIPAKTGIIAANGSWTPDGKSLIFVSTDTPQRRPEIHRIELATRTITRVPTPPGLAVSDPHWEGNELVFVSIEDAANTLWTMKAAGSDARQITHPTHSRKFGSVENYGDFDPKLSPDGSKVAFMRIYGGEAWRVMVLDRKTGEEHNLTAEGVVEGLPTWSSDGKLLLYRHIDRKKPAEIGLYTMTPEGNDRTRVPLPRGFLYNHGSFFPGGGSSSKARIIYTGTRVPGL